MNCVSAPGAPSIDRLQVLVQSRSITASKCISKLPPSQPRNVSSNLLHRGLQMYLQTRTIMASKCISKLGRSRPPSISPNSLDHDLGVHLQVHSITASKCISKYARLLLPCAFRKSLDHSLGVYPSSLARHSQAHLELLSGTACSQSRYTVC
jgi:hypothetical protein